MKQKTTAWDVQDYLTTPEECVQYIQADLAEAPDDAVFIAKALGDVARSRGMTQTARSAGISREGLYKALSDEGNPSFDTILRVLGASGMRFQVAMQTSHPFLDPGQGKFALPGV